MRTLVSILVLSLLLGCSERRNSEAERDFSFLPTALEDRNSNVERRDAQGRWELDSQTRAQIATRLASIQRKPVADYFEKKLVLEKNNCLTPTNQVRLALCDGGIIMCNEQQFYVGSDCVSNVIAISQKRYK